MSDAYLSGELADTLYQAGWTGKASDDWLYGANRAAVGPIGGQDAVARYLQKYLHLSPSDALDQAAGFIAYSVKIHGPGKRDLVRMMGLTIIGLVLVKAGAPDNGVGR